jgi:oxygen-independent coproporphyrinogen-3 oxidase
MNLQQALSQPYSAYAYAYPHKTAYRALQPPRRLEAVWADESREALFGYVHIPFCTYRCGFCNLFALGAPREDMVQDFLKALERQIQVSAHALGTHQFARFAIGGGTPSYLSAEQFQQLVTCLQGHLAVDLQRIPFAIEVAPDSATPDRLCAYREAGVDRISMGVQSFVDAEMDALVRPRQRDAVLQAVREIRELDFRSLNLDLIYGIAGQSVESFLHSLQGVLELAPEELYLYPLYVRPLTGLGRIERNPAPDLRSQLYAAALPVMAAAGYTQVSMRMFKRTDQPISSMPDYRCQDDGMLGLGCGARSYTRSLHYSGHYAVARTAIRDIIAHYAQASSESFACVEHGFELDQAEQRRRYLIQSLLLWPGLEVTAYRERFGANVVDDFPQLLELLQAGLAKHDTGLWALTAAGMAHADAIGPWLGSAQVQQLMEAYARR